MNQNISYRFSGPCFSPLSLVIASVLGTLSSVSSFSTMAAEQTQTMETITVTGNKTSKTLKETPTGVSVFTEDQFANGEYKDTNDLVTKAPNVVTDGFGTINIRGINSAGAAVGGMTYATGGRARVSTIVDGDTQSWSGYNYTGNKLWDVQQVEVLRGPQSTVQGTNSIGGSVVVKTNDPTFVSEASVRAGMDFYKNGNTKNNLALMFNTPISDELALRVALDGEKGEGWMNYSQDSSVTEDLSDVDESTNYNLRAKLLWEPQSNPALSAKLTLKHSKYEGDYLNWAYDGDYSTQSTTLSVDNSVNTRVQDSSVDNIALDVDYHLSDGILNSLHVSYLKTDVQLTQKPSPFPVISKRKQYFIEDRLLFNDTNSNWSGVTGLYLSKNEDTIDVNNKATYDGGNDVLTAALYGETYFQANENLTLIGGGRFEHEKLDRDVMYGSLPITDDTSTSIFLPKIGVTYDFSNDTVWGATVQKGYNAGGNGYDWNSSEYYEFDDESVIAYETSIKSQINPRSDIALNLFYNAYSDYQAQVSSHFENIDKARTLGAEVETNYWLTDNLQATASLGVLNSKIQSDEASSEGNELPSAPKTNAALGFTQYIGQDFSFGADVTYVGKYYSDMANTETLTAGDYVVANARTQYTLGDFSIDAYINNLSDEDIIYFHNRTLRAAVGQTRTVGISVTYKM